MGQKSGSSLMGLVWLRVSNGVEAKMGAGS